MKVLCRPCAPTYDNPSPNLGDLPALLVLKLVVYATRCREASEVLPWIPEDDFVTIDEKGTQHEGLASPMLVGVSPWAAKTSMRKHTEKRRHDVSHGGTDPRSVDISSFIKGDGVWHGCQLSRGLSQTNSKSFTQVCPHFKAPQRTSKELKLIAMSSMYQDRVSIWKPSLCRKACVQLTWLLVWLAGHHIVRQKA